MDMELKNKFEEASKQYIEEGGEISNLSGKFLKAIESLESQNRSGHRFDIKIEQDVYKTSERMITYIVEERMGILRKVFPEYSPDQLKAIFLGSLGEYKSKFNADDLIKSMSEMETYECSEQKIEQSMESVAKNVQKTREKERSLEIKDKSMTGPTMTDLGR